MLCPQCQAENRDEARFCGDCGAKLERLCPSCGNGNPPANKFCDSCGSSLQDASADPTSPRQYASPETYTPDHLAERILTSKTSLEGERKQVTVLFADLKGSMELLGDRDPEDARALLDAVLTRMMEAVHRFEGTVNQVMGDGIMALFGAPLALEDHALRACYAALAIQNSMQAFAEEARREHGVDVQARVGMNSGEVVVRTIGSDLKMDYTAVGQTTNLAARMEQFAPSGSIRMTAETLRFAEGFVQVESLGPVPIKGMSEAVEVYELNGAASGRTRFQATAAGGLSRFVGRTSELEGLESALHKAGEGQGQLFATVAEAGVGKSRLYWEFIRSPRTKEWLVVESGSVSYGKATAYKPVIDLLKAYFSIEDTDDHRRTREKVTGKILTLDESLTSVISPVLSLLEVPIEDEGWTSLDPSQKRLRILDGVKGLMLREAKVQPLSLVFEDLHWIDTETQALLDSLVESLPGASVLLLVNYRPEYEHGWANKTYYTRLTLDPLTSKGAEELLGAILGGDSALDPLKGLLIERTQGNPFYLEESVQTLIESGALTGGPGAYRLTGEVSEIEVPSTVQAILAARIDRLPPEDKRLLQTASVIGTHVPYPLLSAIAETNEEELQRGLSALQASEFLYETNLFPEREYTFKHALTHEVTYGGLVQERKRVLHAAITEAIEEQAGYRLDEHIERLAHHAYEGEVWEKAVSYLHQTGERAMSRAVFGDALRHSENSLKAIEHLPRNRKSMEQAVDAHMRIWGAYNTFDWGKGIEHVYQAEALAEELGDNRRRGHILATTCAFLIRTGNHENSIEVGRRALAIAESSDDVGSRASARFYLGAGFQRLGQFEQTIELYETSIESLKGDLLYETFGTHTVTSVMTILFYSECLNEKGRYSESIKYAEEAIRISEKANHPYAMSQALIAASRIPLHRGIIDQAIEAGEKSLKWGESHNFGTHYMRSQPILGLAYALVGRIGEAIPLIMEGIERGEVSGLREEHSRRVSYLGEACLIGGKLNDAGQAGFQALDLARKHKERPFEAWALRLLGDIHSHPDALDPEKAEENYRQALALAEELGMRPLIAHCRKGLGALYGRTGQDEKAHAELTAAMDMYRDMEMTFWLEKAEAAMAEA
jgi:class 3 adenylate cyclase/tetratricopeptide (TPR) repeat protein